MDQMNANVERLKAAYAQWHETKGGSVDTWLDMMDDEIDFRSLANGAYGAAWTQEHTSREGVRAYLTGLKADMEMIHYTVDRLVCQDDCVVMLGSTGWRHRRNGRVIETPKVDVMHFRGNRIVRFQEFYDTAALAAVFAA